jgi:hypothetical protein
MESGSRINGSIEKMQIEQVHKVSLLEIADKQNASERRRIVIVGTGRECSLIELPNAYDSPLELVVKLDGGFNGAHAVRLVGLNYNAKGEQYIDRAAGGYVLKSNLDSVTLINHDGHWLIISEKTAKR